VPEHVAYMSPQCAQLHDAIRTGPSRGLLYAAMWELRDEYRRKCTEDEQQALQRLYKERLARREARIAQQTAQQAERSRAELERSQCDEMLRILHGRRQRVATMSEGEKGDLQRFEQTYAERCRH
jgi:hypothetical protein